MALRERRENDNCIRRSVVVLDIDLRPTHLNVAAESILLHLSVDHSCTCRLKQQPINENCAYIAAMSVPVFIATLCNDQSY